MENQENSFLNQRPNSEHHYHISLPIFLVSILLAILIGFVGFTFFNKVKAPTESQQPVYTQPSTTPSSVPTADETASWKEVTLENLSFRIPSEWFYKRNTPRDILIDNSPIPIRAEFLYGFTVSYRPYEDFPNIYTDLTEESSKSLSNFGSKDISISDGISAITITGISTRGTKEGIFQKIIVMRKDDGVYFIHQSGSNDKYGAHLNKILSTFEFLDESPNIPEDWNTYINEDYGFSVRYPSRQGDTGEGWVSEEFRNEDLFNVGFGTRTSSIGGYFWGIHVYEDTNLEDLISETGSQFSDRKESRENISIDGNNALLVTVTTNEVADPDWVSETIYVQRNSYIYSISNGAHTSPEFDKFYESFEFIN